MADSSLVEGVKLVGSIIGLFAGLFILYDRIFRHRPMVSLQPGQRPGGVSLRIKNNAEVTVIVEAVTCDRDEIYVAKSNSLAGAVGAALKKTNRDRTLFLPVLPQEERLLPIKIGGESPKDVSVKFVVKWHTPSFWPLPLWSTIRTSAKELGKMAEATVDSID